MQRPSEVGSTGDIRRITELGTCPQQSNRVPLWGRVTVKFFLVFTPLKYVSRAWPQPSQETHGNTVGAQHMLTYPRAVARLYHHEVFRRVRFSIAPVAYAVGACLTSTLQWQGTVQWVFVDAHGILTRCEPDRGDPSSPRGRPYTSGFVMVKQEAETGQSRNRRATWADL